MTSVAKDRTLVRHQPPNKITKIQILWCKYFLLYSLIYMNIVIYLYSFICVLFFIFIILIISYCIIIHPRICIFRILLGGWCRTRVRPARLVSNVFLYTTFVIHIIDIFFRDTIGTNHISAWLDKVGNRFLITT